MAVINMRGGWTPTSNRRQQVIYKADGPANHYLIGARPTVEIKPRHEVTPDVVIGIGHTANGAWERLQQQVAHQSAELALAAEVNKSMTMVELDAVVTEQEHALAGSLGAEALQGVGVERELVGAS